MDGQDILGSPFSVMVSIPPTKLAEPVIKLQISGCCYGIVVNSQGELIASTEKGVVVMGYNYNIQRTLVKPNIKHYSGLIAIDKFDVIYCARGNELLRCNQQGMLMNSKQVDNSRTQPTALTVVGDKVMTCYGSNTVKIYDLNLNYVRSVEHRAFRNFRDFSSDSQGNLYAAATDTWGRCRITVFSNAGNYLRSFGAENFQQRYGTENFQQLYGLCVSGQYIYFGIASIVHIFTIAGDRITSIAHNFQSKVFIHVDKEEFVWVASSGYVKVF